tara:strand:+ start:57941 stop:58120 length:180 start_codon:yes stop_codon:yes gene_type:complete
LNLWPFHQIGAPILAGGSNTATLHRILRVQFVDFTAEAKFMLWLLIWSLEWSVTKTRSG